MTDEVAFFTPEQARALWQDYLSRQQLNPSISKNQKQERQPVFATAPDVACVLDEALSVASNSKTSADSATATICRRNPTTGQYTETTDTLQVWNHSESKSFAEDTFGFARMINGHWVFFGDCEPMAAR